MRLNEHMTDGSKQKHDSSSEAQRKQANMTAGIFTPSEEPIKTSEKALAMRTGVRLEGLPTYLTTQHHYQPSLTIRGTGDRDRDNPEILATFNDKPKNTLQYNCLVRESLEIRRLKTSRSGLNDPQLCVKTNAWDPILQRLN